MEMDMSDGEEKVLSAVEAYFSELEVSLIASRRNAILKSPDGMLPLASVCLACYKSIHPVLKDVKEEDFPEELLAAIAKILRASDVLKVSEDGRRVGMANPLSDSYKSLIPLDDRTLIVYPIADDVKGGLLFALFSMHAKVRHLEMSPTVADENLLGAALVEFETVEDASIISKKRRLKINRAVLELKPMKEFVALWEKLVQFKKTKSQSSYPKDLIVAFKLKRSDEGLKDAINQLDDQTPSQLEDLGSPLQKFGVVKDAINQEADQTPSQDNKDVVSLEDLESALQKFGAVKDAINQQDDQTPSQDNKNFVLLEDLESVLQKFGAVKYVDFQSGSESGYILFEDAEASQNALQAAKGGVPVKNCVAYLHPVTGEAEKEYWSLPPVNQDGHCIGYKGRDTIRGGMQDKRLKKRSRDDEDDEDDDENTHRYKAQKQ